MGVIAAAAAVAFVVAACATPAAMAVARRTGIVDRPGPLKVHREPVAYLGGTAVLAGLLVPVASSRPALLVPLGLALALGLADDVGDLSPRFRLAGELVVGVAGAAAVPVRHPAGFVATVVLVVALVNAVNLLDGLDALASSVVATGAVGFAVVLAPPGRTVAVALAASLAGFLLWNRPPARIYLGDAGSYLLGATVALLLALAAVGDEGVPSFAGAVLFAAVPVADTAVAIVRRARAGRPLLQGDRGHVYDQLVDRGWPPLRAVLACAAAQAALVAAGIGVAALAAGPAWAATAGIVAVVGVPMLVAFTSPATWVR